MDASHLQDSLRELIEPFVRSHGLELWGIEAPSSPRGGTLRVYIDAEGGVTIDQCATLSKGLNHILDVEDPIPGPYTLEVSSPGLERPFFSLEQLKGYTGRRIGLKLGSPFQGSRKWRGSLIGVENDAVVLEAESGSVRIPWGQVKKARLIYDGTT
jgi:ribosome maturation factor RimP